MDKARTCLRPHFFCSIPKDDAKDYRNEDQSSLSTRKDIYALSDGASISFDSWNWARILTRQFGREPNVTEKWIEGAIAEFNAIYNREELSWSAQAAFDRGSFATLLGLQLETIKKSVKLFAVGDTIAVLLDDEVILDSYPYSMPAEFNSSPMLISTNPGCNQFMSSPEFPKMHTVTWSIARLEQPSILCMTDALGHWFLTYKSAEPSSVSLLLGVDSKSKFRKLVDMETKAGRLRRDDTTFLKLG